MLEGSSILIENVTQIFTAKGKDPFTALQNVSLSIDAGEFITIIGPSGCGKSTLLRLIAGLDLPSEGTILVAGKEVTGPDYLRGFVFQSANLYPWDTVWKNVAAGLIARNDLKGNEDKVDAFIEMVNLKGFEKAFPKELSGGMTQRVALARALINNPNALLLDEPLGSLDALTRIIMQDEILRIWNEQKITMVFVTHDIDEAIHLGDRAVVMTAHPGKINQIIDIDLPRPRNRAAPEFDAYRRILLDLIFGIRKNDAGGD